MARIAVLGAGAWGTAIACALSSRLEVALWARDRAQAEEISASRKNDRYLPGIALPTAVQVTSQLERAVSEARLALAATPVAGLRELLEGLPAAQPFVWLCKGFEEGSGSLPHQIAEQTLGKSARCGAPETFMGLAGAGDLILTATGDLSRNRRVGLELARGRALREILEGLGHVAEGVRSAKEVSRLAAARGVEMPVTDAVKAVLEGRLTPAAAVELLLSRDAKMER